jgi:hypothetical protein
MGLLLAGLLVLRADGAGTYGAEEQAANGHHVANKGPYCNGGTQLGHR